ncbi:MAG: queuosine precursor transporter [Syntrophomonas sp.]|uniref:queuosine precursor transporter n=1 Tax=Syntrophomonas sp. TaxID=2053627 RepID=UPI002627E23A|nr:queuosine precursor transporter [Syntrophomonas sp.]MDD4627434.1 queuosine precursor transporter [Syntrophomonas sp.]
MIKEQNKLSHLFVIIACLFVTALLLSNIIAGKLITIGSMILPGAVILFPLAYIFGDILTEVYGYGRARMVIWTGFACNILMVGVFFLVIAIPSPGFFEAEEAFATVLGMTPRIVMASLLAYLLGEFSNAAILSRMKILTRGKWLWTRTIGSTLIGEGLDTIVFITVCFLGVVPNAVLLQMVLYQYLFKVAFEILATPLTYAVVGWLKRREGIDTYDHEVSYNPFQLNI